jgi:hypothetical protein
MPRAASRCRCDRRASSTPPWHLARASFAIRSSFVDRLWSPMSPPSFPRTLPCFGAPFPRRGPSGWFPRVLGVTERSDFLPPLPRRFVSFASRYRRALLPQALPRFLEDPLRTCRALQPRWDDRPLPRFGVVFPPFGRRRLSTITRNFEAQSHGPPIRCLRFARWVPHRHARLASGGWPTLPGGIGYPPCPTKGFRSSHPPSPSFAWRAQRFSKNRPPPVLTADPHLQVGALVRPQKRRLRPNLLLDSHSSKERVLERFS